MQHVETDPSDSKIFFHANHLNRITIPLPPNRFPGLGGPNPNLVAKPDSKPLSPFKVHQVRVFDLHFQFRIGSKKSTYIQTPFDPHWNCFQVEFHFQPCTGRELESLMQVKNSLRSVVVFNLSCFCFRCRTP